MHVNHPSNTCSVESNSKILITYVLWITIYVNNRWGSKLMTSIIFGTDEYSNFHH